ncbi:50S ribosomal protein L24 [Aquipuribacter sp. MA13-6]|uniref:50S ribosomal protein L24 n=1 Tax=unclassified Aquipuribacter TaxID=2635084 RepID=UPI003EE9691F
MASRGTFRIKKGDTVVVIAGARQSRGGDRGKTGKVLSVNHETNRVLVEGINRVTKHVKAGQTGRGSRTGGLIHTEAPVHVSNVALVDPESGKPTRVGIRVETQERGGRERNVRVRVARRSGKDIA